MSDVMHPLSFSHLMNWILSEYQQQKTIFGVSKIPHHTSGQALPIFKEKIESPFGPAAGPHTQLAENIVAAYAGGSRFFELKTVQIMDGEELSKCVAKPCIAAKDECYNCEWSTELTVPQAFSEYVKAYFACKLLAVELGLGDPDAFVFNMSVGYDLAGIQSPKIDAYIEGMKDASGSAVWQECTDWARSNLSRFSKVDEGFVRSISPKISDSITLSTLHGCPPDEIERIATYLITEKGLNTYVKCNPTLLGYDFARRTLDDLGFTYIVFDDHHFKEDLQFSDAAPMFRRLTALTLERGLEFGVKLTNTFPVEVAAGELPSEEMYMSGRALYPLTMALAARISKEFDGKLRISYSGGADLHSIEKLVSVGIWPITMATTLLKPGGYDRLHQLAELLMNCGSKPFGGVDPQRVAALAEAVFADPYYRKPIKPAPSRKNSLKVPLLDCFSAPCRGGCPIEQDIPLYLRLVGEGRYEQALEVITQRNPLPFITGTICAHHCMDKCTRSFYEDSVHIRDVKLEAAQKGYDALLPKLTAKKTRSDVRVAVVGGGPAGLSAAYFLGREGVPVTIFERSNTLGGIVRQVIPEFRIPSDAIDRDIALVLKMGAEVRYGVEVHSAEELKSQGFTHVIFACGAWKPGALRLEAGAARGVIAFLADAKAGKPLNLGKNVIIVGGGNTAMDAARLAKRQKGVETVTLVYRRDARNMPAEEEELQLAREDGVVFAPLLAPISFQDGALLCHKMVLGAPDGSGRRAPEDTGEAVSLPADTVIAAVGEKVDSTIDTQGGVAVLGDMLRGPATVVEAIADGTEAARKIVATLTVDTFASGNVNPDPLPARAKHGVLQSGCDRCSEPDRCLECATLCENCVEVCPNRANVAITVPGHPMPQILHVDDLCNECGNCQVFCPYDSAPYQDKFTLFSSREHFEDSKNAGFLPVEGGDFLLRLDGKVNSYCRANLPCDLAPLIGAVMDDYGYLL